jgi:hypothetical protein
MITMKRTLLIAILFSVGCGTTRVTDTPRAATEQLLVSHAVDQAVAQLDLRLLAGKTVFFDALYLDPNPDRGYLISSMRQHLLACGCLLQEKREDADFVVEARSGALSTDRHGILVGVPAMNIPVLVPGQPSQIPEIPFAKKTDQKGYAKIGVFAYQRRTGQPVFQSGIVQAVSTSKDLWLFGTGPFQKGDIHDQTQFAGQVIEIPFMGESKEPAEPPVVAVTEPAVWNHPKTALRSPEKPRPALSVLAGAAARPVQAPAERSAVDPPRRLGSIFAADQ